MDTEFGLLVPVIRNADQKNITQIAVELHQLSEKARAKKLTLDEMSGGGISISNLGGIGGTLLHADRELARGRDSRRLARHHRTGVWTGSEPSSSRGSCCRCRCPTTTA